MDKWESSCTDTSPDFIGSLHSYLTYKFFDKKLFGFTLVFPEKDFIYLEPMLRGKYGEPHHTEVNKVHNKMNAEFEQLVAIWNTPYGPMKLYSLYGDMETGMLILEDESVAQMLKTQTEKAFEEKGKSVF